MDLQKELKKERKKKEDLIKEGLKIEVECGEQLAAIRGAPGWKLIEKYLSEEMEIAMNTLLSAKTEREMLYSQAVVNVIKKLFEKIGVSYQIASNAAEILKQYENK